MNGEFNVPLLPGESIVWQAPAPTGLVFRPIELFLIPFSILWGGFAIFWNASVWSMDTPMAMRLFGLPFLLAGAYVTVGRFIVDWVQRRKTRFFLTNQRVIETRGSSVKSLDVQHLPTVNMTRRADGSGTIRFGQRESFFAMNGLTIWQPGLDPNVQFLRISNVDQVYQLVMAQSRG